MSWVKKAVLGCSALLGLCIIGLVSLWAFFHFKQSKYDEDVIPFLQVFMKDLSWWDPKMIDPYWAPEVQAALDPEGTQRLFLAYQKLGALVSFEDPIFVQVGIHPSIPYPEYVTYQVAANYSAGPATLSLRLVKVRGQLRVWALHIDSSAFLPEAPPEQPKPEISTS